MTRRPGSCRVCGLERTNILPPSSLASIVGPKFRTTIVQGIVDPLMEMLCLKCQAWAAKVAKVIA
jgi:hypothetical protein